MKKFVLNLASGESLALVQELSCFDDLIKLDPLLSSSIDMCFDNMITGCMLDAIRVELSCCQCLCYL
jgi:hypothetical protein